MKFDLNAARSAGYSDDEIAEYLASQNNFDLSGALSSGYSSSDIVGFLSTADTPAPAPAPAPEPVAAPEAPGFLDNVRSGLNTVGGTLGNVPGFLGTAGSALEAATAPRPQAPAPAAQQNDLVTRAVQSVFDPRPENRSVLESYQPTEAELTQGRQSRLAYGAGPIRPEVVAAAGEVKAGQAQAQDQTVQRVADAMRERGEETLPEKAQRLKGDVSLQRMVTEEKAKEFRSVGEFARDAAINLTAGAITLAELPINIVSPSSKFASDLRAAQKYLTEQESEVLAANRQVLADRVLNEEGFLGQYLATVGELVTNPTITIAETLRQVPMFLGVVGAARGAGALTGTAFNVAERASPAIALSNVITQGGVRASAVGAGQTTGGVAASMVMAGGDAAGSTYQQLIDPQQTPKDVWEKNSDYQRLIAEGVSHQQAVEEIATAKSRAAAMIAAPLGLLGFMGAEAALVGGATRRSVGGVVARELIGEQIEEGGTQVAGNIGVRGVDPSQDPLEGVAQAAGTALITSGPFAAAGGIAQARANEQLDQPTVDPGVDSFARTLLDPNAYDPTLVDPRQTVRSELDVGPAAPATARTIGTPVDAARVGDGTLSFTPATNLTAQAGLTPIVVPDPAITAPMPATGDLAGVTVPGALPRTQLGRASDADLLARAQAAAGTADAGPVEQWFGRKGDGYITQGDAQQALPGRARMFPNLNWTIEQMPNGKFRLAGYDATQQPGVQSEATITPTTQPQQGQEAAQALTQFTQEITGGPQTAQTQQAEAQGQEPAAAVPTAVTGQQIIANPELAATAGTITFAPGQIGALRVAQRRELNQSFTSQEMDDGSVVFTRTDVAPIGQAGDQGQRAAFTPGAQAVDSPLATGVVQTLNDASIGEGTPQRFAAVAPEQTAQAQAALAIAETFSKPVVFVRATGGNAGFNAYYDPSFDGIVINADSKRPMFAAVLHEVGHSMPADIRTAMVDAVLQTVTPEQRARFNQEFPFYSRYSEEVQNEELVMRIIEQDAENPQLWQRMADRMGDTAFARFARDLLQMLDNLMARFTREDSREFTSDIERVRTAVAEAYAQTLERTGQDATGATPEGVRASVGRKPKTAGEFNYTTDDKGRINVAGDIDRIRLLTRAAAKGTPSKDGSGITFKAEDASAVVKALKGAPKADPRIAADIAQRLDLSDTELDSTSLEFQTGEPGERAFSTPFAGSVPETVQFLENRRRESGLPVLDIAKPEDQDTLAKLIAAETLAAIRSSGNALEWYDVTIARTLAMASVKYPELANDPNAQTAFRLGMAIASQGLNVENNLKLAMRRYEEFRNTGRFPEVGEGESAEAMVGNFRLANELIEEMGPQLFRRFLSTEFTIGELNTAGFDPGGELVNEVVLGSSVFGPKIGFGFYSNLNGNFEPVTMDMWFMRTMGRLTGNLRAFDEAKFAGQLKRFRDAFTQTGNDGVYANRFDAGLIESASTDQEAAITLARQVKKAHEKDFKENRAAFDAKQRKKTSLVLAAETMIMSVDKPKDVPGSGTERRLLREVVRKAVDRVAEAYGQRVPPAAMQALIWYPEQELYKSLGVKLSVTSQDYAGATEKVLKEEGYDERQLRTAAQSGARRARQANARNERIEAQGDGQGAGTTGPLQGTDRERFIRDRFERVQLARERVTPSRRGIVFEVAPDPNNVELTDRWNTLSNQQRLDVSERIAREIVPRVLSEFNSDGILTNQVGSYIDQTNPSFTVLVNKGDVVEIARTMGFVLAQDSMVVVSPKAFKGGEQVGSINIELGDQTPEQVDAIYQSLREIDVNGERPIGGQSYANGVMTILNFSNVPTQQLAVLVDQKLNKGYTVMIRDAFAAFPEKESYDYGSEENDGRGSRADIRRRARDLRAEATTALERELAGITPDTDGQRFSAERGAGPATVARGPGARPDAADGRQVTGIHYGRRAGLSQLTGTSFGTGIRGAEQERLNQPGVDPRIKQRVYFYLTNNNADMPRPEIGLGVHVYRATLGNMYDSSRASQADVQRVRSLMQGTAPNAFESAVLDAGYRGYVNREQGTAVVLNANVPVAYEGTAEVGRMRDRTPERLVPRIETRPEGSDFVRRPTNDEMTGIVRARPALAAVAPSFRLEFGEARVAQAEAAAADQALADSGATFRFGDGRMMSVDRGIGAALQARVDNEFDALVAEYNALPGTNGGRLLDADMARELSPEYRQDKTRAAEVHNASSNFVQKLFEQRMAQSHDGDYVVFMAGGGGAGKSSANTLLEAELGGAGTIVDGTLASYDKARRNIQTALDSGRGAVVAYVYREPVEALQNGVLTRAMETGRTVPVDALVRGHAGSSATVRRLAEEFAGNEDVQMRVVDNSRGFGNATRVELSDITPVIESGLKERFVNATQQDYEAGRISEAVYQATVSDAGAAAQVAGEDAPGPQGVGRTTGAGREPGRPRYSVERQPFGFYSELANQIERGPNQAPKDQWKAYIKGLQGKGVKQDEITWTGIEDWLELQTGKVQKADVMAYLNSNGVEINEAVMGDADRWVVRVAGDPETHMFDDESQAEQFVQDEIAYQLDGQYFENDSQYDVAREEAADRVIMYEPGEWLSVAKYQQYTLPGGTNYREVLLTLPAKTGAQFTSTHWDQKNVVAHMRLNDRIAADGSKVLFVEEIQSDWGQAGKKQGFMPEARGGTRQADARAAADQILAGRSITALTRDEQTEWNRLMGEAAVQVADSTIPTAPFVTKTEGWLNLSLKRITQIAAEGGYDKVAFVKGQQSADRYSLDKQVDRVKYAKNSDGTYDLAIRPRGQAQDMMTINDRSLSGLSVNQVEDFVGKEVAKKIVDGEGPQGADNFRTLSGLDLKVGGKGMVTFYDTIVTTALKKLLPKIGGEKMGTVSLVNRAEDFVDLEDATEAELAQLEQTGQVGGLEQPGFDVTPAMRETVRGGLPMFSAQRQGPVVGQNFQVDEMTRVDRGRRALQDDALRMKRVIEAVREQGGVVGEAQNFYDAYTLMPGRVQSAMDDFRDNVWRPMLDKAVDADIDIDELALYAYAKHAAERNAYIASINPRLPDGGSGMTNADAAKVLADVADSGKQAEYDDLHGDLMAITSTTRQMMLNEGIITQKEFDAMTGAYEFYIPLRGFENVDEETGASRPGVGRGVNVRGKETMRALGRSSRAGDLIENALRDYERVVQRVEKNDVGKVLLDFVLSNPDPDLWGVDVEKTTAGFDKKRGVVQYTKVIDKGEDTIGIKVGGQQVYIKFADKELTRALRQAWKDEISGLERATVVVSGWWNNWMRNVLTRYNPAFAAINIPRDALWSGTSAALADLGPKGLAEYLKIYPQAMAASSRQELGVSGTTSKIFGNQKMDRYFQEFRAAGGITGGFYMRSLDDISSDLRTDMLQAGAKGRNVLESIRGSDAFRLARGTARALEFLGTASENATRFALYMAARETGKSPAQAGLLAKNGTTNFNRKGEWGGTLNNMYLFYNASVQGLAQLLYVMKSPAVQASMAGVAGVGMMLAFYGASAGGEDDDGAAYWDKIPSFVKERNIVIMLPPGDALGQGIERVGKRGRYILIPVQYGFNFFPNIGYSVADVLRNAQDPKRGVTPTKAALHMTSVLLGSVNPFGGAVDLSDGVQILLAASPTLTDLPIQLVTERNTFGDPSSPARMPFDMRPDSERMFASQIDTVPAKIAQMLNEMGGGNAAKPGEILGVETSVTPGTIKTLISSTTGGLGTFMEQVSTSVLAMSSKEDDLKANSIPFVNKFYGEVDEGANMRLASERMRAVKETVDEVKNQFKLGLTPEIGTTEQRALALADAQATYQKLTTEMRRNEIEIIKSNMTDAEKKLLRQQIRVARDQLATQINKIYLTTLDVKE